MFADILGFKQIILASDLRGDLPQALQDMWQVLNPAIKELQGAIISSTVRQHQLKAFTDNIEIGWPIRRASDGEGELGVLLFNVALYQLYVVSHGYFIRGGMDIGEAYFDQYFAFGLPIISSYELESNKATYPRIILSEKLIGKIQSFLKYYAKPQDSGFNSYLLRDFDNLIFLDYVGVLISNVGCNNISDIVKLLDKHKNSVVRCLHSAPSQAVKEKILWTIGYHNYSVRRWLPGEKDLLIPASPLYEEPGKFVP